GTHKELGRTLPPSVVTDTSYVLDLPAQSTLLLEITHNFRSKHYGSVSVSEKELLNEDGSYLKEFSKKRSGPSKYTIWYDILNGEERLKIAPILVLPAAGADDHRHGMK